MINTTYVSKWFAILAMIFLVCHPVMARSPEEWTLSDMFYVEGQKSHTRDTNATAAAAVINKAAEDTIYLGVVNYFSGSITGHDEEYMCSGALLAETIIAGSIHFPMNKIIFLNAKSAYDVLQSIGSSLPKRVRCIQFILYGNNGFYIYPNSNTYPAFNATCEKQSCLASATTEYPIPVVAYHPNHVFRNPSIRR